MTSNLVHLPQFFVYVLAILALLVAVVFHEVAHGYVAFRLGDPTARNLGRLSLNPIKHIDPFLTIALPALLIMVNSPFIFGGAKPVPIDPYNCRNPVRAMAIIAAAGPLVNFILAALSFATVQVLSLSGLLQVLPVFLEESVLVFLYSSIVINLVLAIFNLVPIPPLDGGRIAVWLLPKSLGRKLAKLEPYGIIIVFLILLLLSR